MVSGRGRGLFTRYLMAKFSDDFRANAIIMLIGAGFEKDKTKAVNEVYKYYSGKVAKRTLFRWGNGENNPAPAELVTEKKEALADLFENAARIYLAHGIEPDVVSEVSGQASMTAAAIAVDKMQLLRGLPTEIIGLLPEVLAALKVLGQDPADVFNRIIQRAAAQQTADQHG